MEYLICVVIVTTIIIFLNLYNKTKRFLSYIYIAKRLFDVKVVESFDNALNYKFINLQVSSGYFFWQLSTLYFFSIFFIEWHIYYLLLSLICFVFIPVLSYVNMIIQLKLHYKE